MSAVTHNIGDLNSALGLYQRLRGMTDQEVLEKQGGKLAREIFFQLRGTRPEKGSIRSKLLARLAEGRGIRIRPSVVDSITAKYGQRFQNKQAREEDKFWGEAAPGQHNWKWLLRQKMVQREIGLRESGRGILSISSRYKQTLADENIISRYGSLLSSAMVRVGGVAGSMAQILWPGTNKQSSDVVGGLQRPRGSGAVKDAIHITTEDILAYTTRKQKELVTRVVKKMVKA